MSQNHRHLAGVRRSLRYAVLGLLAFSSSLVAQGDSVPVGQPPHFAAAWASTGTFIDISHADTLQRRVSLDLTGVSIHTAIRAIMDSAKLGLFYFASIFPADLTVSIHVKNVTATSAFAMVLAGTGVDVFMLKSGHLVLGKCPHLPAVAVQGDSGTVTGRVTDRTTGVPLAGGVVTVEQIQLTVTTNAEGQYRLVGLPAGRYIVEARYIGYVPVIDTVIMGAGGAVHHFALEQSAQPLEQVVVTGTLVPTEVKALPTPIAIITADDIRRQHVTQLAQLFRGQVAGALAWDRAADDYYNTINIRGITSFSTRSIKTFIDGVEVADPQFTALIDPNSIERIELTRGPQASTMYGSDAIGGVLQIFTKKGEFGLARPEGEVQTAVGLVEKNEGQGVTAHFENAIALRGGEEHTRYQASAYYQHDGEWTPSYHSTAWNVAASAENVHGPLTSRVSTIFARRAFDRPWFTALRDSGYVQFSRPPFETIDLQTQTVGLNFVYAAKSWWRHELVLGYDRYAFGLVQTEPRFTTPDDTLLQVIMNQRGKLSILYYTTVSARLSRAVDATLTAGFNHYRLDGSDASSPATTTIEGTLDGPTTLLRLPSTNSGYFAQTQIDVAETAFLTAGFRAERSPSLGRDVGTVVSPRFGAAYVRPIGPMTMKLRASYGESIRAPDPAQNQPFLSANFERLYNPALKPERQRGSDGGLDLSWGSQASLSVTYYRQKAIDLIDRVILDTVGDPPRQQTQQQNVGQVRNQGWEIEAQYRLNRLQISGAFSFAKSRIQQLASGYSGTYLVGDSPLGVPTRTAGLTVAYSPSPGTVLNGSMTNVTSWVEEDLIGRYGFAFGGVPRRPSDRDYWIAYPGFAKFRVGIEHKLWNSVEGAFDIENVTNQRTFETTNLNVPSPRTFTLTLRVSY